MKNKKQFFQNIKLDNNGNISINLNVKTPPTSKGENQYKTYSTLKFDDNNNLNMNK